MYRVYMDHELVYMPGDRTLALFSAKAELKVNGTGSFTFTMYPDHPAYGKLELMRNIIAIHSDSQSDPLFLCRPYQIEYGTHNEAKVSCEGTLGFLNDSLVEPANMDFADNPMNPVTLLGIVIDAHNSYVGDGSGKRIQLGTVRSDLGDALISDENVGSYPSSWNVVTNYLVERFGGYIVPGYAIVDGSYATYLNWYSSIEQVGTQTVELGKNLVKFNRVLDGTDAFSTIIPQGKDGITIATDDDPATSITDPELEAAYGRISRVVEFDTDDPADLKVQALKYIADEKAKATEEITVGAVDLSLADKSVEAFRLGEKIIVDSPYHGLVSEEFVTDTISINLNKPSDGTLTLGKSKKYLTKQSSDDIRHRVDRLERKQDVSFTGYLGQHDSAPTAGLKDGAFFLYTGETTDTMTQGRIYEYDAETMSWGKTTDEYAVMACLHDALTNAKDTDKSLYALVAFVYTIGVHNLLVDAGGKIQSANYEEYSNGYPSSGFRMDAPYGLLKGFRAMFTDAMINGANIHGADVDGKIDSNNASFADGIMQIIQGKLSSQGVAFSAIDTEASDIFDWVTSQDDTIDSYGSYSLYCNCTINNILYTKVVVKKDGEIYYASFRNSSDFYDIKYDRTKRKSSNVIDLIIYKYEGDKGVRFTKLVDVSGRLSKEIEGELGYLCVKLDTPAYDYTHSASGTYYCLALKIK